MKTAAVDGVIYGNEWQTIYDSGELASAQTSITISDLDGNTDKEYRVIARFVNGYNGTCQYGFRPNGDSASNYGNQYLRGQNTVVDAGRSTSQSFIFLGASLSLGSLDFADAIFYAKSGYVRTSLVKESIFGSGTTVDSMISRGSVWNNTSDNITSLSIVALSTDGIGVGSRIILMRRSDRDASTIGKMGKVNAYGKIKGCFQQIYSNTLSAPATSVTITGLDGDTDVLYRLVFRGVNNYNGAASVGLTFNGDSGTNYGYQRLYGSDAASGADRYTAISGFSIGNYGVLNDKTFSEVLVYAKSGYVRTGILNDAWNINGTTISAILLKGFVWNNTATNMYSMTIDTAGYANGLGTGTVIELWAYRP